MSAEKLIQKKKHIAFDFIGIASDYQGGANIFATTFLEELASRDDIEVHVILSTEQAGKFEEHFKMSSNLRVEYFLRRDLKFIRILHFLATRIFISSNLLSIVQKYRWKNAIKYIEMNCDSCLSLTTYISFPVKKVRHFITMHDIQERALPNFFTRKERNIRHTNVKNSLRNVSGIQVSSKFVQEEILKYYPDQIRNKSIEVIPEGYSRFEFPSNSLGPRTYLKNGIFQIVFPANHWPHKRHETLIRALEKIEPNIPIKIIFTGNGIIKIFESASEFSLDPRIELDFRGYVGRRELLDLYTNSDAVISCSMYESSSLPILEGAVSGCALIASDIPAHKEMALNLNVSLFQLNNPESLAKVIEKLLSDLANGSTMFYEENILKAENFAWPVLFNRYLEILTK